MNGVSPNQRHTKQHRCPVCDGADGDPRGKGKRCSGFTSSDGEYTHCSRAEMAGGIDANGAGLFAHRMHGSCKCGHTHGEARTSERSSIVATYDYRNAAGALAYQVVRLHPKSFRLRRPDGLGGWSWKVMGQVELVPYRYPELLQSPVEKPVYIVEGEKDADVMAAKGFTVTTNATGAGKFGGIAALAGEALKGRDVLVVADADAPGRDHARDVLVRLTGIARNVTLLECPAPHKDASDLFGAGGSIFDLVPMTQSLTTSLTTPLVTDRTQELPQLTEVDRLAPELPFDEIWTAEPDAKLVIPALGIAPGPAHLVTGSWYTGKTLLLATIGLAVASGSDLFGLYGVKRGPWVHFDHEMGRRHLKRYIQRLQRGMKIDIERLRDMMSLRVLPLLNLTSADAVDHYTRILDGCAVATIDPLRAAAPGQDENKSEFRQYLDLLAVVSDRTGCAIMVLHHGGKPTEGAERRNTGRGTSAIDDAVQSKFVLTAKEKGAPMLVTHEKTRELTSVLGDFYLEIDNSLPDRVRLVHHELEEMAGVESRREEAKHAKAAAEVEAKIAAVVGSQFIGSREGIRALVKAHTKLFDTAWAQLLNSGALKRAGTFHKPTWTYGL